MPHPNGTYNEDLGWGIVQSEASSLPPSSSSGVPYVEFSTDVAAYGRPGVYIRTVWQPLVFSKFIEYGCDGWY